VTKQARRFRWRTLREDYLDFADGNLIAALLLDYFASVEAVHSAMAEQGERTTEWREISGRFGGLITLLRPMPSRVTIRTALNLLVERGLIEPHADNGRLAEPGSPAQKSRYRLNTSALLEMEANWRPADRRVSEDTQGVSTAVPTLSTPILRGVSTAVAHESVVVEREEGGYTPPPYEPPEVQSLRNDTLAQMNGWTLVAEYADVTGIAAETIWASVKAPKIAAALVKSGITPQDVREFILEKKRDPERYSGYRFPYLAEDLPRWKQQREDKPAPRVLSDIERAQREAQREADQIAWWKEQGLL